MTDNKLDFEYEDIARTPNDPNLEIARIVRKLKQVCEAVDAMNEVISNMNTADDTMSDVYLKIHTQFRDRLSELENPTNAATRANIRDLSGRLDINTNAFIFDIQNLTNSIIKINERLDKLEKKECDHDWLDQKEYIEGNGIKCTKCGAIE